MVKYSDDELDTVFAALSDRTRRRVLQSLAEGDRPVFRACPRAPDVASRFPQAPARARGRRAHRRTKEGRVVSCELSAAPMKEAALWMSRYEKFWTEKLDSLARYLYQQEELQTWSKPSSGKSLAYPHPQLPRRAGESLARVTDPQAVKSGGGRG